jgi:hypothetical protein
MLVSHYPNVSINTANPPTEMARRDALRRDLFEPVKQTEKSAAEKPVVTDEKARIAGNNAATVSLYDAGGKETETQQAVAGRGERQSGQQGSNDPSDSKSEQQANQQEKQEVQPDVQQEVRPLTSRDQEVSMHEQAYVGLVQQTAVLANTSNADASEQGHGFADAAIYTDISYTVSAKDSSGAVVFPQRDTPAITAQMQLRRTVIAGFYQRATEPQVRQTLQQA